MKRMTLAALALVGFVSAALAEVKVTVEEVSDQRTTGGFFKGLELALNLQGPELLEAKGMSIELESAKDDLGTDISKIERFGFDHAVLIHTGSSTAHDQKLQPLSRAALAWPILML